MGFVVSREGLMGHVVGHIFFRLVENIEGISTIEEFSKWVLPAEIKGKSWSVNQLAKSAVFDSTPPASTSKQNIAISISYSKTKRWVLLIPSKIVSIRSTNCDAL